MKSVILNFYVNNKKKKIRRVEDHNPYKKNEWILQRKVSLIHKNSIYNQNLFGKHNRRAHSGLSNKAHFDTLDKDFSIITNLYFMRYHNPIYRGIFI